MTWDPHCYECKVRYRDPKPKDLVMYLHAWRYKVGTWELYIEVLIVAIGFDDTFATPHQT